MPTPISGPVSPRTQTIDMDAISVPPPRTPAAGGSAPPRGVAPARDEFSARPSTTNGAQSASAAGANPRAQLRAELESARQRAEQIALPPARTPAAPQPRRTLEQTVERQHDAAAHHMFREGMLTVAGVIAHGTPLGPVVTALSAGARTLDHMAEGETATHALQHAARDVVMERVGHLLEGHSPLAHEPGLHLGGTGLVEGGVATFEAAAHILHDGHERARVAGEESAYRAAQDEVAQQDAYSRMDGRNAANGVGNASATDRLDFERMRTDRAYAVAVRQTIEQRLQGLGH